MRGEVEMRGKKWEVRGGCSDYFYVPKIQLHSTYVTLVW